MEKRMQVVPHPAEELLGVGWRVPGERRARPRNSSWLAWGARLVKDVQTWCVGDLVSVAYLYLQYGALQLQGRAKIRGRQRSRSRTSSSRKTSQEFQECCWVFLATLVLLSSIPSLTWRSGEKLLACRSSHHSIGIRLTLAHHPPQSAT